ncbi:TPA: MIP/aquaporin family protein [Streptococcus agalactiae]
MIEITWTVKYITEFIATAFLIILGNGAVANVDLKGTKGNNSGWIIIAIGYGLGVMMPALMFGNVSGNHINPAFTLGLAFSGLFPWAHVGQYILAQILGAMFGQLVVVMVYQPYFVKTENPNHVLGSFSTISALDDGQKSSRKAAYINGFLVMTLVASLGGPTGPALNPARDLGPRIVHRLLPKQILGQAKEDSKWWYAWVPVLAPIVASILAVALFKLLYL